MLKLKIVVSILTLILFTNALNEVKSISLSTDTIVVMENNVKTNKSILYSGENSIKTTRCDNAICRITQNRYPVMFYLPKDYVLLMTFEEFENNHPRTSEIIEYTIEGEDAWVEGNKNRYKEYLEENSEYISPFDPGISKDEGFQLSRHFIGGKAGTDRTFTYDVTTGSYQEDTDTRSYYGNISFQVLITFIFFMICCGVIILFIIKKTKKEHELHK